MAQARQRPSACCWERSTDFWKHTCWGQKVRVGGKKPWDSVGYFVETANVYPELSKRENLEAIHRLRPGTAPKAVDRITELLGLTTLMLTGVLMSHHMAMPAFRTCQSLDAPARITHP